jgi:hypothetical protein
MRKNKNSLKIVAFLLTLGLTLPAAAKETWQEKVSRQIAELAHKESLRALQENRAIAPRVGLPFQPFISDTVPFCVNNTQTGETLNVQLFSSGYGGKGLTCLYTLPWDSCTNEVFKDVVNRLAQSNSEWQQYPCDTAPTENCESLGPQSSLCVGGYLAACTDKPFPNDLSQVIGNSMGSVCEWGNGQIAMIVLIPIFSLIAIIAGGIGVYVYCAR